MRELDSSERWEGEACGKQDDEVAHVNSLIEFREQMTLSLGTGIKMSGGGGGRGRREVALFVC